MEDSNSNQSLIRMPIAPLAVMEDRSCIDSHPLAVYLARLSPDSRPTMRGSLEKIAESISGGEFDATNFPWWGLRYQHTVVIRTQLASHYAPNTTRKMLSALRGILEECWRLGLLSIEDYQRATDLKPIKGRWLPKGRALGSEELQALFEVCAKDDRPLGKRDSAMLALLYGCGLRRAEVVNLKLADYDATANTLKIKGKGDKHRIAYVTASAPALAQWLKVRGDKPGYLFVRFNKGGKLTNTKLSSQAVRLILRHRAEQAHLASCSPHDMRRTFISHLLDAGADISTVQQMAGHASVQTTTIYDRRGDEAKRKASKLLRVG